MADLRLVECKTCGKLFFVPKHSGAIRFCSDECREARAKFLRRRYELSKKSLLKICPICGNVFVQNDYRRKRKYCSEKCSKKAKRIRNLQYDRRRRMWREYQKPLSEVI